MASQTASGGATAIDVYKRQVQDLHWWKFKAMFDALRPDCLFSKIVEWRSTDLTQVKDPKEKKFIQEMKQVYRCLLYTSRCV